MAAPSASFIHGSPARRSADSVLAPQCRFERAIAWSGAIFASQQRYVNRSLLLAIGLLLLTLGPARAQPAFTSEERKLVEQVTQSIFEQCTREPLFGPSTDNQSATSFDVGRSCACKRGTLRAEITPGLLRRNSPQEDATLFQDVKQRCEAEEFLASFVRDCPAVVGRTFDLDAQARRGRRLKNAGGAQALCGCLVDRMREMPAEEFEQQAHSGLSMIASARRTSTPISLDTVVEEEDLAACGWQLEAVAAAPALKGAQAAALAKENSGLDKADLTVIGKAIDNAFAQWSTQWMWDRYIPESVLLSENKSKNGVTLVRGTFKFSRGPQVATIQFASTVRKHARSWVVTTLCYNDTTSGMTDCTNSGVSAGVRNFMGAAILGGLMAAIRGYDGSRNTEEDARYRELDEGRRERQDQEARATRERDEQERRDRDWSRMFEPNPMLPPPATIN